eukprot:364034-Chlamydomonas_euryale.AAC.10
MPLLSCLPPSPTGPPRPCGAPTTLQGLFWKYTEAYPPMCMPCSRLPPSPTGPLLEVRRGDWQRALEGHDVGHDAQPGVCHVRMHLALFLQRSEPGVPRRATGAVCNTPSLQLHVCNTPALCKYGSATPPLLHIWVCNAPPLQLWICNTHIL